MDDDQFSFFMNKSASDTKITHLENKIIELYDTQQKIINKFNKFIESYNLLCDLNEKALSEIEILKQEISSKKSHKKRKLDNTN
jgi:hypothetical protein